MTRPKWTILFVAWLLMAGTSAWLWRLRAEQRLGRPGLRTEVLAGSTKVLIDLPAHLGTYVSTNYEPTALEVSTLPKDTSFAKRLYVAPDGFQSLINAVMMGTDRTSIHKPEYCLTSQGWQITQRQTTSIRMTRPYPYDLRVRKFTTSRLVRLADGQTGRLSGVYVFWFVSEHHLTASHWARVSWITWDLLRTGVLPRWAYVSCFAACHPGQEQATFERIKALLALAVPEFQVTAPPAPDAAPLANARP